MNEAHTYQSGQYQSNNENCLKKKREKIGRFKNF